MFQSLGCECKACFAPGSIQTAVGDTQTLGRVVSGLGRIRARSLGTHVGQVQANLLSFHSESLGFVLSLKKYLHKSTIYIKRMFKHHVEKYI